MEDRSIPRWRMLSGWVAVAISAAFASFWGFWGSIENFHEGWYSTSVWQNIGLMFLQYLSPMLLLMGISAIVLRWRQVAIPFFTTAAIAIAYFLRRSSTAHIFLVLPLLVLGGLFFVGRPEPRRWAWRCLIGLPLLTAVVCGAYPGWRAVHRLDDGNYGMRLIEGNGIVLAWAPQGPGWPSTGASWEQANRSCAYLAVDGRTLAATPQNTWRLPTVDEAVRSQVYRGRNAGGTWDRARSHANYRVMPDKDSPLWQPHSQIIYWWTGTEAGQGKAYRIAYNGYVLPVAKRGWASHRCVAEPSRLAAAAR